MIISDVFGRVLEHSNLIQIARNCSNFINQQNSTPLLKGLSNRVKTFERIKVRKNKHSVVDWIESFNQISKVHTNENDLFLRSFLVNGVNATQTNQYYIFPPNGFKVVYNTQSSSLIQTYKKLYEKLMFETRHEITQTQTMLEQHMSLVYSFEDIVPTNINTDTELLVYNIPYVYGVRTDTLPYNQLIKILQYNT